jgi:hypothetical protein
VAVNALGEVDEDDDDNSDVIITDLEEDDEWEDLGVGEEEMDGTATM